MIDNGFCFGDPKWDETLANNVGNWCQKVITEMADSIVDLSQFKPYIDKVKNISDDIITEIVDEIPTEWNLTTAQSTALKSFLMGQRDDIENIVEANKSIFKNLKDVEKK